MADETLWGPKSWLISTLAAVFTAIGIAWKTVQARAKDSGHAAGMADVDDKLDDLRRRIAREFGERLATLEAEVTAIREELARDTVEKREILRQLQHVSQVLVELSRDVRALLLSSPTPRQQTREMNH